VQSCIKYCGNRTANRQQKHSQRTTTHIVIIIVGLWRGVNAFASGYVLHSATDVQLRDAGGCG